MSTSNEQLVVVWRIYEPCNLGCHFCGYSREIIRKRRIADPQVVLNFGKLLSAFQRETGKEVVVSWLGGEPLLWRELPGISNTYHNEFLLKLGITTNGTRLGQEEIRSSLVNDYSLVTISLDGFAQFHDLHRGEQGLFEKIRLQVAELLKEIASAHSPLRIRVNTILMRENLCDFESFCMEMAGWGIRELTFNQLGGIDRPKFYPENRLLPEQARWLAEEFPHIQRRALDNGLKIYGNRQYLQRIVATSSDIAIPVDDCNPGARFLFINEEGLASPCNFTSDSYGIPISSIKDFEQLRTLPTHFRAKQLNQRALPCNDCHSTQIFDKFMAQPDNG